MSLANLNIVINANAGAAISGLRDVGSTAKDAFKTSNDAVDGFRTNLTRSADTVNVAAGRMGSSMAAANDAIVSSTAKGEAAVQQLADTANAVEFKSLGEKMAAAFGTAFGTSFAVAQTWLQKTEAYVEEKVKIIAIGLAIAAVSATAGVVYGAYRLISGTLGFVAGLFTGESYKAASIDQLVALNDQVKALQSNLNISAQEANALLDATKRLGVDKSDYAAAFKNAETAMRTNGDELDRLGVKYKDTNGELLDQRSFLENVKKALDEYAVGWDRTSAAAAMGAGTYDQVSNALKVTQGELEASKARLDEYQLGIGPQTQAAVSQYEQAMRDFNNETELTSRGFSRAIADSIMPALTDLAVFFKDGFPFAVRAFRGSLATVTSLLYGLKTVADFVVDAIKAGFSAVGSIFEGTGVALMRVFQGDFSGAIDAFKAGMAGAVAAGRKGFDEMIADATKNRDRMIMAWGFDDRTQSLAEAKAGVNRGGGKKFVPKPAPAPEKGMAAPTSAYQNYLNELDRTLTKVQQNEYAAMRLKAAQLAQKEGITDLSAAYQKINDIQRQESQKVVDEMVRKMADESDAYAFQTSLIGLNALEQDKLTFAKQKQLDMENAIAAAKKSGKPLDDQAIADLKKQTDATIALGTAQRDVRDAITKSFSTGSRAALQRYQDDAANAAKFAEDFVGGSLSRLEDAIVTFAETGKLNFGNLFKFMADEFLRQVVRMQVAKMIGDGGGFSWAGLIGTAMSMLSGSYDANYGHEGLHYPAKAAGGPVNPGEAYMVGEKGPEVLRMGSVGGYITPNGVSARGSGDVHIHQVLNIGAGVNRAEMAQALAANNAQMRGELMRQRSRGEGAFR